MRTLPRTGRLRVGLVDCVSLHQPMGEVVLIKCLRLQSRGRSQEWGTANRGFKREWAARGYKRAPVYRPHQDEESRGWPVCCRECLDCVRECSQRVQTKIRFRCVRQHLAQTNRCKTKTSQVAEEPSWKQLYPDRSTALVA